MGLETAAIIGLGSLAVGATSTGLSIGQASRQKKLQKDSEAQARIALADAKKKISVNYMDQLSIAKEPYRLAREAALSSGAQALEYGIEGSERGVAATAGRVMAAQNQAQQQIGSSMEQEIARLDQLSANADTDIAYSLGSLDLQRAQGAQFAARDAQQARNAAISNAIETGASTLTGALETFVPLYQEKKNNKTNTTNTTNPSAPNSLALPYNQFGQQLPVQQNFLEQNVPLNQMIVGPNNPTFGQQGYNPNPFMLPQTPQYTFK
jgi:hypothetical protein